MRIYFVFLFHLRGEQPEFDLFKHDAIGGEIIPPMRLAVNRIGRLG